MEHENKKKEASLGKALVFSAGKGRWACELGKVKEIVRSATITPLPNSTDSVVGVINVRGEVVPVVDLWSEGLREGKDSSLSKKTVVILQTDEENIGIKVGHVSAIEDIQAFDLGNGVGSSSSEASPLETVSCNVYLPEAGSVPLLDVGLIIESLKAKGQKRGHQITGHDHAFSAAGGIQ